MRSRDTGERVTCIECGVGYRPVLTLGECPVCGVPVGGDEFRVWRLDDNSRTMVLLLGAGAANVLLLAVMAAVLLG